MNLLIALSITYTGLVVSILGLAVGLYGEFCAQSARLRNTGYVVFVVGILTFVIVGLTTMLIAIWR